MSAAPLNSVWYHSVMRAVGFVLQISGIAFSHTHDLLWAGSILILQNSSLLP